MKIQVSKIYTVIPNIWLWCFVWQILVALISLESGLHLLKSGSPLQFSLLLHTEAWNISWVVSWGTCRILGVSLFSEITVSLCLISWSLQPFLLLHLGQKWKWSILLFLSRIILHPQLLNFAIPDSTWSWVRSTSSVFLSHLLGPAQHSSPCVAVAVFTLSFPMRFYILEGRDWLLSRDFLHLKESQAFYSYSAFVEWMDGWMEK